MSSTLPSESKPRLPSEPKPRLPSEPELSKLTQDELAFLINHTGITDVQKLKEHIHEVQLEACKIVPYGCILNSFFTKFGITQHPLYDEVLQLGRSRTDAIYLEFACCFGNDVRKLISDGYPLQNVIVCDLHPEFWELGHKLFKSNSQSFPVPFISGDIFDHALVQPAAPIYTDLSIQNVESISELKSLTPLQGRVSIIYTSAFFHLFEEDGQLAAARVLASLLSPKTESTIFGQHLATAGPSPMQTVNHRGEKIFCHSSDSWKELWNGVVFNIGTVSVNTELRAFDWPVGDEIIQFHYLYWSVRRL